MDATPQGKQLRWRCASMTPNRPASGSTERIVAGWHNDHHDFMEESPDEPLIAAIATALTAARRSALEEAAKVAEDEAIDYTRNNLMGSAATARSIASTLRALAKQEGGG